MRLLNEVQCGAAVAGDGGSLVTHFAGKETAAAALCLFCLPLLLRGPCFAEEPIEDKDAADDQRQPEDRGDEGGASHNLPISRATQTRMTATPRSGHVGLMSEATANSSARMMSKTKVFTAGVLDGNGFSRIGQCACCASGRGVLCGVASWCGDGGCNRRCWCAAQAEFNPFAQRGDNRPDFRRVELEG